MKDTVTYPLSAIIDEDEELRPVKYRCSKCGGMHHRDSNKKWIKSWCGKTDGWSRLMRVEEGK